MRPETFSAIRLPNLSARIMRSTAEAAGLDWRPLLAHANLAPEIVDDPNGIITGAQELLLQEAFVRATRELSGIWLRMGLQYRLMSFGPLGLAVLAAGTFGAGLRYMSSFRALTYSLMEYRPIEEDGELIAIEVDDRYVAAECREFCHERGLGAATRVLNDMHPGLSPILRIETMLDSGRGRRDCVAELGAPVVFDAPVTRLILKPGAAATPLPMANPLLEQTYGDLCTRLIDEAQVSDELVNQLYKLLIRETRHFRTAPEASRQLGLSERTLYRRLAAQGLTFGQVLDRVREQRASYLLDNSELSIEQIAESLGFAEAASFSRAFKRWTGRSPLTFRHRSENGRGSERIRLRGS